MVSLERANEGHLLRLREPAKGKMDQQEPVSQTAVPFSIPQPWVLIAAQSSLHYSIILLKVELST